MLGQRHFFKPRAYIEFANILRGHAVIKDEYYRNLIELGQRLAPLSAEEHIAQNIIQGCQSQVWIVMEFSNHGRTSNSLISCAVMRS
jgi:sulfur transfer protein SufE